MRNSRIARTFGHVFLPLRLRLHGVVCFTLFPDSRCGRRGCSRDCSTNAGSPAPGQSRDPHNVRDWRGYGWYARRISVLGGTTKLKNHHPNANGISRHSDRWQRRDRNGDRDGHRKRSDFGHGIGHWSAVRFLQSLLDSCWNRRDRPESRQPSQRCLGGLRDRRGRGLWNWWTRNSCQLEYRCYPLGTHEAFWRTAPDRY